MPKPPAQRTGRVLALAQSGVTHPHADPARKAEDNLLAQVSGGRTGFRIIRRSGKFFYRNHRHLVRTLSARHTLPARPPLKSADRLGYILEPERPYIGEHLGPRGRQKLMHFAGNHDPSRRRLGLKPYREIDTGAVEIIRVLNDFAAMNPHAEPRLRMSSQPFLRLDRTIQRRIDTAKGDDPTIAHALQNLAAMAAYHRFQPGFPQSSDQADSRRLVCFHHP